MKIDSIEKGVSYPLFDDEYNKNKPIVGKEDRKIGISYANVIHL